MNRYSTTQGLVINKKAVKENDLLITLLSPDRGKIKALAKGARNIRSSRLSSLQLGNIIKANLYQKDDRLWLSEAQTLTPFLQRDKSLVQLNLLFYFLEIINAVIAENQFLPNIYQIAVDIITAINTNRFPSFIKGEIRLLQALGFGLPQEILTAFSQPDYRLCQQLLRRHFESIIEKDLESYKLFK